MNAIEIINVLVVIYLLYVIVRKRDVTTLLVVLFVYGTLHFGFAAIALATNDPASLLITLHNEGGGVLAKLSTLTLLGVVFGLLSRHAYDALVLSRGRENKIILHILLTMAALLCGYFLNIRQDDWLQLKNVISIEAMLTLLLIGFLAAISAHTLNVARIYSWGLGGLFMLGATDCIAIYEVFGQHSWASTVESSGVTVYRASSILFNPNLFGFWASLVYLGCAYGLHACKEHRKMMLWGMVLASIAIYFSGSRSAGYLLLAVLIISTLLIKGRLRWISLVILPLTMLTIYAVVVWLVGLFISTSEGWREIALLGNRFAVAPVQLFNYALMKIGSVYQSLGGVLSGVSSGVPVEIVQSIEGRYIGEGRDAGWMVLYQDVGWFGLGAAILASFMLVAWGVRAYIAHPIPSSVYTLALLLYCLITGFVMRFQIFPVWLFIGLVLVACVAFWRQLALPAFRLRS